MGQRVDLQAKLEELLGSEYVYFQPPANVQMVNPCIVYHRENTETLFAGNNPYRFTKRYEVTVIDRNPDSEIPDRVAALPMCLHDRTFAADNLNHYVFTLYF